MTALARYAASVEAAVWPSAPLRRHQLSLAGRIEDLQDEIARLEDLADELAVKIDDDDAAALMPLHIADCAALHAAAGELLDLACRLALDAGWPAQQIADILGLHRTTLQRRLNARPKVSKFDSMGQACW